MGLDGLRVGIYAMVDVVLVGYSMNTPLAICMDKHTLDRMVSYKIQK